MPRKIGDLPFAPFSLIYPSAFHCTNRICLLHVSRLSSAFFFTSWPGHYLQQHHLPGQLQLVQELFCAILQFYSGHCSLGDPSRTNLIMSLLSFLKSFSSSLFFWLCTENSTPKCSSLKQSFHYITNCRTGIQAGASSFIPWRYQQR